MKNIKRILVATFAVMVVLVGSGVAMKPKMHRSEGRTKLTFKEYLDKKRAVDTPQPHAWIKHLSPWLLKAEIETVRDLILLYLSNTVESVTYRDRTYRRYRENLPVLCDKLDLISLLRTLEKADKERVKATT